MTKFDRPLVWLGGALFVGSLALTAWTIAVWFDISQPWRGWGPVGADACLLTAFALHHSVFARDTVKQAMTRIVPDRLLRSVYVWIASLLLVMVCVLWRPIGGEAYRLTGASMWVLRGTQLGGLWLIASSVTAINALELAGIRPPRAGEALQRRGPYGLVRHPLYLGWILIVFGPSHMTGDRLAFAVLTTCYLLLAIPWEEVSLERGFGDAYRRYKQSVPWRVIPYVY